MSATETCGVCLGTRWLLDPQDGPIACWECSYGLSDEAALELYRKHVEQHGPVADYAPTKPAMSWADWVARERS